MTRFSQKNPGLLAGVISLSLGLGVAATLQSEEPPVPAITTVNQIADFTPKFIGKSVRVIAQVQEVFDETTFSVEDPHLLGSRILVVAEDLKETLAEASKVELTGIIQRKLETQFDTETELELDGSRAVLIAESVEIRK